jgi:hypothetical protein
VKRLSLLAGVLRVFMAALLSRGAGGIGLGVFLSISKQA